MKKAFCTAVCRLTAYLHKNNYNSTMKKMKRDRNTVNEDVECRIWNMWAGQKQDESCSRNAAVSNTIQTICGSRGIRHPTIKRVRWSETLRNVTKNGFLNFRLFWQKQRCVCRAEVSLLWVGHHYQNLLA